MVVHRLSKDEARRIAVRAQLLDRPRPTDLVDVVDRLTVLQIDPTAAIAPSADLVLWSRLGSTYDPADLTRALEHERTLVETVAYIRRPATWPPSSARHGPAGSTRPQQRGSHATSPSAATSSRCWRARGPCCRGTSPTRASSRGPRPDGPTTGT
jgi:hypothetical protein